MKIMAILRDKAAKSVTVDIVCAKEFSATANARSSLRPRSTTTT